MPIGVDARPYQFVQLDATLFSKNFDFNEKPEPQIQSTYTSTETNVRLMPVDFQSISLLSGSNSLNLWFYNLLAENYAVLPEERQVTASVQASASLNQAQEDFTVRVAPEVEGFTCVITHIKGNQLPTLEHESKIFKEFVLRSIRDGEAPIGDRFLNFKHETIGDYSFVYKDNSPKDVVPSEHSFDGSIIGKKRILYVEEEQEQEPFYLR